MRKEKFSAERFFIFDTTYAPPHTMRDYCTFLENKLSPNWSISWTGIRITRYRENIIRVIFFRHNRKLPRNKHTLGENATTRGGILTKNRLIHR